MKLLAAGIFFIVASVALAQTKNNNPRGICPRTTQGIGICKINPTLNCESDSSCDSGKICCPDGCNRNCQYPEKSINVEPVTKPGQCKILPPKFGSCVINPETACSNDEECSGSQKCCNDGCNLSCQYPVGLEPHKGIVKEGACKPAKANFGACVVTDKTCSGDSSCPDDEKCCNDGCNLTCQSPEKPINVEPVTKPGQCKILPPKFGSCVINPETACSNDEECSGSQKCCNDGCNLSCQYPVGLEPHKGIVKEGVCKVANKIGACVIDPLKSCTGDAACPDDQKCCNDGCNLSCQVPAGSVGVEM